MGWKGKRHMVERVLEISPPFQRNRENECVLLDTVQVAFESLSPNTQQKQLTGRKFNMVQRFRSISFWSLSPVYLQICGRRSYSLVDRK